MIAIRTASCVDGNESTNEIVFDNLSDFIDYTKQNLAQTRLNTKTSLDDATTAYQMADFFEDDNLDLSNEGLDLNEDVEQFKDVVTVRDLMDFLGRRGSIDDKIVLTVDGKDAMFDKISSNDGITSVKLSLAPQKMLENINMTKSIKDINSINELMNVIVNCSAGLDCDSKQVNFIDWETGKNFGIAAVDANDNGISISLKPIDKEQQQEDFSMKAESGGWARGGYGGTGRSWARLDRKPRGREIGWYAVSELDPKAAGKMSGWRCGPSNFPFKDLLYPERKYKVGTMVMRNKYLMAGSESGVKYIAVPSYFYAIKTNDTEAIKLLNALGIPLDLTFGMNPDDDYSMTFTM